MKIKELHLRFLEYEFNRLKKLKLKSKLKWEEFIIQLTGGKSKW